MSAPTVTVLMPARNAAAHVEEAARSILAQTVRAFELLVVDDASSDDTVARLEALGDPRIRIVRAPERLKLAGALNLGIREARGALIARMDADDLALPRRLEKQAEFLRDHPEIAIVGSDVLAFGAGPEQRLRYPSDPDEVVAFALFNCPFAHPAVMFRRAAFIDRNLFYDVSYYPTEDYELWSRALRELRGANIAEALLRYRRHAASMTGSDWSEMDRQAARVQARMLAELGLPSDAESAARHRACATGRIEPTESALRDAERWLLRVRDAARNRIEESVLMRVLADRWFTLAMACAPAGMTIWAIFQESPFAGRGFGKMHRASILAASIVRRAREGAR